MLREPIKCVAIDNARTCTLPAFPPSPAFTLRRRPNIDPTLEQCLVFAGVEYRLGAPYLKCMKMVTSWLIWYNDLCYEIKS